MSSIKKRLLCLLTILQIQPSYGMMDVYSEMSQRLVAMPIRKFILATYAASLIILITTPSLKKLYDWYDSSLLSQTLPQAQANKILIRLSATTIDPRSPIEINGRYFKVETEDEQLNIARFLMKNGADLKHCDENGCTAPMHAIREGHERLMKFFLEKDPEAIGRSIEVKTRTSPTHKYNSLEKFTEALLTRRQEALKHQKNILNDPSSTTRGKDYWIELKEANNYTQLIPRQERILSTIKAMRIKHYVTPLKEQLSEDTPLPKELCNVAAEYAVEKAFPLPSLYQKFKKRFLSKVTILLSRFHT